MPLFSLTHTSELRNMSLNYAITIFHVLSPNPGPEVRGVSLRLGLWQHISLGTLELSLLSHSSPVTVTDGHNNVLEQAGKISKNRMKAVLISSSFKEGKAQQQKYPAYCQPGGLIALLHMLDCFILQFRLKWRATWCWNWKLNPFHDATNHSNVKWDIFEIEINQRTDQHQEHTTFSKVISVSVKSLISSEC